MLFPNGTLHVKPENLKCVAFDAMPYEVKKQSHARFEPNILLESQSGVVWIQGKENMWNFLDSLFPTNPLQRENVEYFLKGYNLIDYPEQWIGAMQVINDLLLDCDTPFLTIRTAPLGDTILPAFVARQNASLKAITASSSVVCSPDQILSDIARKYEIGASHDPHREVGDCVITLEPYLNSRAVEQYETLSIISHGQNWDRLHDNRNPEVSNPYCIKIINTPRAWKIVDSMDIWVEVGGVWSKHQVSSSPMITFKKSNDDYNVLRAEIRRRMGNLRRRIGSYCTLPLYKKYLPEEKNDRRTKPYYTKTHQYWKDSSHKWEEYHGNRE